MNKYDICQFSILQEIPVHVGDLTESPVKKFKPSLSSHYPSGEVMNNEHQVIFLSDNGKSRSMEDKNR